MADMIDRTVVRAHPPLRGRDQTGAEPCDALGRSRGGFSTKPHARCYACGLSPGFALTPGWAHDIQGFGRLFRVIEDRMRMLPADRSDDADTVAEITFTFNTLKNRRRIATQYA